MRVLDLFSGIGGFSLAAHWAGFETAAFCEQDKFCQKVLAKNFSGIPIFDDIKTLKGDQFNGSIDIVCGGFPCQPWSTAGKRRGKEDDRHLWPEMLRVIREVRPRWVVGENVAGIVRMGLDDVLADLENEGYTCRTFIIPACGVGAQHRRDRVWIVAYSESVRRGSGGLSQREKPAQPKIGGTFKNASNAAGIGSQSNTEPDCCQSGSGQESITKLSGVHGDQLSANTNSPGHEKQQLSPQPGDVGSGRVWQSMPDPKGERSARQAKPGVCGSVDGVSARLDTAIKDCFSVAAWVAKEETGPNYKNRIKALGNSIVPQVVYPIFKAIAEIEFILREEA